MYKFKCLFISVYLLYSFLSCSKRCNEPYYVHEVDANVMDYFGVYKEGNYWIYKSSSNKTDSIFVSFYDRSLESDWCYDDEKVKFKIRSRSKTILPFDSASFSLKFNSVSTTNSIGALFFHNIRNFYVSDTLFNADAEFVHSLSRVVLNGTEYEGEIQEVKSSENRYLYLKRNIGLIGWIVPSDTFNLVDSKITF